MCVFCACFCLMYTNVYIYIYLCIISCIYFIFIFFSKRTWGRSRSFWGKHSLRRTRSESYQVLFMHVSRTGYMVKDLCIYYCSVIHVLIILLSTTYWAWKRIVNPYLLYSAASGNVRQLYCLQGEWILGHVKRRSEGRA